MKKWYGESTNPHYGIALAAGTRMLPGAFEQLVSLSSDELYPVIVRATALSLLGENYPDSSAAVLKNSLKDIESLIRYTAIHHYPLSDLDDVDDLIPLLNDPVKAVRFEAAIKLSVVPREQFPSKSQHALDEALIEYREAMEYSADFAASRHNLGNYYSNTGRPGNAIENYKEAIEIDALFYPAKVNLAIIYNQQGKNDEAELLLKSVLESNPQLYDIHYSLGLLLAEQQKYSPAVDAMEKALEFMPDRIRIYYNLGLMYQQLGETDKAEKILLKGLGHQPESFDLLFALADFYMKTNRPDKAKPLAQKLAERYPESTVGNDILKMIR
ncbi:MAG: tetratricopeptide repeat protein [Bacteroidales bacterium]